MHTRIKTVVFWAVMVVTVVTLWRVIQTGGANASRRLTYTEFHQSIIDDNVEYITITNGINVGGRLRNGDPFQTTLPSYYPGIIELLSENGVVIDVKFSSTPVWIRLLNNSLPFLILLGAWIFMMRRMKAGRKML